MGGSQGNVLGWVGALSHRSGWEVLARGLPRFWGCWAVRRGGSCPSAPVLPSGGAARTVHVLCVCWLASCDTVVLGGGSQSHGAGRLTSARDACPIDGHLTHCTDRRFLPERLLPEAMWLSFSRLGVGGQAQMEVSVPRGPISGPGHYWFLPFPSPTEVPKLTGHTWPQLFPASCGACP